MIGIITVTLYICIRILNLAILAFCILSWFARANQKVYYIYSKLGYYLWPIMGPARWLLSKIPINIPIDFSPWLTIILANLVYNLIVKLLYIVF